MEEEIIKERERIKEIVESKKQGVEVICSGRAEKQKRKKAGHTIAKSRVLKLFDNILYLIDNPRENKED